MFNGNRDITAGNWARLNTCLTVALDGCVWSRAEDLAYEVGKTAEPTTDSERLFAIMALRRTARVVSERHMPVDWETLKERLLSTIQHCVDRGLDPVVEMAATAYLYRLQDDRLPALLIVEEFVDHGYRHPRGEVSGKALTVRCNAPATVALDARIETHAMLELLGQGARAANERTLSFSDEVGRLTWLVADVGVVAPRTVSNLQLRRTEAVPNLYAHLGYGGVFGTVSNAIASTHLSRAAMLVSETKLQRATFAPLEPMRRMLESRVSAEAEHGAGDRSEQLAAAVPAALARAALKLEEAGLEASYDRYSRISGALYQQFTR